jgi:PAS domain S-box-containing protein
MKMETNDASVNIDIRIRDLESKMSSLKLELEDAQSAFREEQEQRVFYQMVSEFAFGWELWFDPAGSIKYCSPSSFDLTGYTSNEIIQVPSVSELLVFSADREKFETYISASENRIISNSPLEFRMLTRTKQIRWCSMHVKSVYDKQGNYLGIRASVQDITRLKGAYGQINDLSAGREIESRNRQRLKSKLEMKERELVSFLIQLSKKNELISIVIKNLHSLLREFSGKQREKAEKLVQLLEKESVQSFDWEMIDVQLEKLHPGFLERVVQKHPVLTRKDKKLCACLRLGLNSREIAGLSNRSPKSVEIARVRLRKKLKLPHQIRLANYLLEL